MAVRDDVICIIECYSIEFLHVLIFLITQSIIYNNRSTILKQFVDLKEKKY